MGVAWIITSISGRGPEQSLEGALKSRMLCCRRAGCGHAMVRAASAEAEPLTDIIVTARRTEERLQDVPISQVSVDTEKESLT